MPIEDSCRHLVVDVSVESLNLRIIRRFVGLADLQHDIEIMSSDREL
jgi:hypothetical protein